MTITKADLHQAFGLVEQLDLELGAIVGRTDDPSLARVAAVGIHCDLGNLNARLQDFRARHAGAAAAGSDADRARCGFAPSGPRAFDGPHGPVR